MDEATNPRIVGLVASSTTVDSSLPLALLQFVNLFFQSQNEGIKLRNIGGVVALFMFAKAEEISDILGTPAVEVEFILLQDQLSPGFVT